MKRLILIVLLLAAPVVAEDKNTHPCEGCVLPFYGLSEIGESRMIGRIYIKDGAVNFEGEIAPSARMFLNFVNEDATNFCWGAMEREKIMGENRPCMACGKRKRIDDCFCKECRSKCTHCGDGDEYPYYGVAPHRHDVQNGIIGSTRLLPKEEWPINFVEDKDAPGMGTYFCPVCGKGKPEEHFVNVQAYTPKEPE